MFVIKTIHDLSQHLNQVKADKKTGFVPTMGALHQGHLELIKKSQENGCYTVCSIFVNPTQFNNFSDLEKYPINIEEDIKLLAGTECDVLFLPTSAEMYGNNIIAEHFDYGNITKMYEGQKRPGHFNGVITIVAKLFDAVKPDEVFFGQKDLQQCIVINHLIKTSFPSITLHIISTYREKNGLAASSRNKRLTTGQQEKAAAIYQTLLYARQLIKQGNPFNEALDLAKTKHLSNELFVIEYFDVINIDTMQKVETTDQSGNYALIIACWCADVRLIDNVLLID